MAIFGRLGDYLGTHKKGWLVGGTLIQALLTLVSAITFHLLESDAPLGTSFHFLAEFAHGSGLYFVGIACLSASLGVQGIMARRLGSAFSTTSESVPYHHPTPVLQPTTTSGEEASFL